MDFDELQQRFVRRIGERGVGDLERGTIVVLPSITFPEVELRKISGIVRYEERLLCLLLMLRNPALRMVYVSSLPIDEAIVAYYVGLLPDPAGARRRLVLVSLDDASPRALDEKLLDDPPALARIAALIEDKDGAFAFPFNVTPLERRVAERLGIPLYGPAPDLARFGTKSGGRRVARRAGVPVLEGTEDLFSLDDVERALSDLAERRPDARAAVIKLNNGFSGQGNAIIDFADLSFPLASSRTVFCADDESWASYGPKVASEGAIVEEQLRIAGLTSPSVQITIAPGGLFEILSTHDQILGGPDAQVYLGCRFPARREYRDEIQAHAAKVARELASEGVIGSFGIDFVVVPCRGGYDIFLSEINLRVGGTTHPFLMARGVTDGTYDRASGELRAGAHTICYVATDNLKHDRYKGLTPQGVLDAVRTAGLSYDPATHTGVLPHMLGALPDHGKLGATFLGGDLDEAGKLHDRFVELLDDVAGQ